MCSRFNEFWAIARSILSEFMSIWPRVILKQPTAYTRLPTTWISKNPQPGGSNTGQIAYLHIHRLKEEKATADADNQHLQTQQMWGE
jgi:hypothetical protein